MIKRARFRIDGHSLKPADCVVTLCQNRLCVCPGHHALKTFSDARRLERRGKIRPGALWVARDLYSKGEIDIAKLAEYSAASKRVAEAIVL